MSAAGFEPIHAAVGLSGKEHVVKRASARRCSGRDRTKGEKYMDLISKSSCSPIQVPASETWHDNTIQTVMAADPELRSFMQLVETAITGLQHLNPENPRHDTAARLICRMLEWARM